MAAASERAKADSTITMRVPARTRALIDSAAAVSGKSRTEFVIESARLHAVDVLLDQRVFELDEAQSAALLDALDASPLPSDKLRALMRSHAPWE